MPMGRNPARPAAKLGGGSIRPQPGKNPYQMQPGQAYLGGSADFDERTGSYRSGRMPQKPGGMIEGPGGWRDAPPPRYGGGGGWRDVNLGPGRGGGFGGGAMQPWGAGGGRPMPYGGGGQRNPQMQQQQMQQMMQQMQMQRRMQQMAMMRMMSQQQQGMMGGGNYF